MSGLSHVTVKPAEAMSIKYNTMVYDLKQRGEKILKENQHLVTCPATILQQYLARPFYSLIEITKPQIHSIVCKRKHSIAPSRLGSEEFCTRLLKEDHIAAVPALGYGESCYAFVRVSVGTASLEENQYGLRKIKELIAKTS